MKSRSGESGNKRTASSQSTVYITMQKRGAVTVPTVTTAVPMAASAKIQSGAVGSEASCNCTQLAALPRQREGNEKSLTLSFRNSVFCASKALIFSRSSLIVISSRALLDLSS